MPVGALALLLTPRFVRESRAERETSQDVAGAVTVTAGIALLVYAVSKAPDPGWGSAGDRHPLPRQSVLLLAFVVIEARPKDPLMPFRIFRINTVAGANVSGLLLGAITFRELLLLTLYVQEVLDFSAIQTGLTFVATAGTAVIWAGVAQSLTTRFGVKPIIADRLRRDDGGDDLVHADYGQRVVRARRCCRATSSSVSRSRSRSSRCRSRPSPASSTTRPGSRRG